MKILKVRIDLLFLALSCAGVATMAQPAISNFMATPGDARVILSWGGASEGRTFKVKRAATATGPLTVIATNLSATSLVVTNLRNGTIYYFAVSAVSDDFESADTARLRAAPSAAVLDLLPAGAKLEKLATGLSAARAGVEGPVWIANGGYVIFSHNEGDRLLRWTPGSGVSVFRASNRPNGSALDSQGRLITCEQSTKLLARTELDGTVTPLVTHYQGKIFNDPNDVVVKSDGTVWFTDPLYFGVRNQPVNSVYRFDPANGNGTVTPLVSLGHPNGLCFSQDESKLFVTDTDGQIRVFDVLPDNTLANNRIFISQGADGIRTTPDDRFYMCNGSVKVFNMKGVALGELTVPESPAHLCFGGTNREMLFITAQSSLYGITRMPDLIVTNISRFPTNAAPGQAVYFSAVIKNQGTGPTSEGPLRVSFSIDTDTKLVWADFHGSIAPDASIILTVNGGEAGRSWMATAGAHAVKAVVDNLLVHRESNESNNLLAQTITIGATAPDMDGDGSDDTSEVKAGTDPADAASVLKILTSTRTDDGRLTITWSSVPTKTYRISRQPDLANLEATDFSASIIATTFTTSWTNARPLSLPSEFYRIRVE